MLRYSFRVFTKTFLRIPKLKRRSVLIKLALILYLTGFII